MRKNATEIMKEFPKSIFTKRLQSRDIDIWVYETHEAAIHFAYEGIQENTEPSPTYLRKGQKVAKEQLAIAGYRTAQLLEEAYKLAQTS